MRVLVIDRQPAFAWGLSAVFEAQEDAEPVAVCLSARHALDVAREQRPDIVTLSLRLPDTDPVELCRQLRKAHSPLRAALFLESGDGRQILDLVGHGLTSREVAAVLSLAPKRSAATARQPSRNRVHALELARARGLISPRADSDPENLQLQVARVEVPV